MDASSIQLGAVITWDDYQTKLVRPLTLELTVNCSAVLQISTSTYCEIQTRSIHFSTSTGQLCSLVRTLRHAIQIQYHQIELLAIVET
jgi:hypothetical protein